MKKLLITCLLLTIAIHGNHQGRCHHNNRPKGTDALEHQQDDGQHHHRI